MQLQFALQRRAAGEQRAVLLGVSLPQRRGEDGVGGQPDQFLLAPPARALDEGEIDGDVAALPVLEEEHGVGDAVEQRIAREGRPQRPQQGRQWGRFVSAGFRIGQDLSPLAAPI